jgi:hypothetical protein
MLVTFGTEQLLYCLEPINCGISTPTWKKCLEMLLVCMFVKHSVYIVKKLLNFGFHMAFNRSI